MSLFLQFLIAWAILIAIVGLIALSCTHLVPRRTRDPYATLPVTGPSGHG